MVTKDRFYVRSGHVDTLFLSREAAIENAKKAAKANPRSVIQVLHVIAEIRADVAEPVVSEFDE